MQHGCTQAFIVCAPPSFTQSQPTHRHAQTHTQSYRHAHTYRHGQAYRDTHRHIQRHTDPHVDASVRFQMSPHDFPNSSEAVNPSSAEPADHGDADADISLEEIVAQVKVWTVVKWVTAYFAKGV